MKPGDFLFAGKMRHYSTNGMLFIVVGEISEECFELSPALEPTVSSDYFALMLIYFQHLMGVHKLDVRIDVTGKPPNEECIIYICMPMPEKEILADRHIACLQKISKDAVNAFIEMLLTRLCSHH
jgi:hypothetical protein